jgi:hypothetical protein
MKSRKKTNDFPTSFSHFYIENMKKYLLSLVLTATTLVSSFAQMTIQSGATVACTGSPTITLDNTGMTINGTFQAGTSTVLMKGSTAAALTSSTNQTFHNLTCEKAGGQANVQFGSANLLINNNLTMTSGVFDLQNSAVVLQTNGLLIGETETARVTASGTGSIAKTQSLNAPSAVNVGNLGATITTTANLGNTTVRRSHQPVVNGASQSIRRRYEISPIGPGNLNTQLRLNYWDAELNGNAEPQLQMHRSPNNTLWNLLGVSSSNQTTNFVQFNDVDDLGFFTLSAAIALPLELLAFRGEKSSYQRSARLFWETANERDIARFDIERSIDGLFFEKMGQKMAIGTAPDATANYDAADPQPRDGLNFYRLKIHETDGRFSYSPIVVLDFGQPKNTFSMYPNPTSGQVLLAFGEQKGGQIATIRLFNAAGRLLLDTSVELPDNGLLDLDLQSFPVGLYLVETRWANGDHAYGRLVRH